MIYKKKKIISFISALLACMLLTSCTEVKEAWEYFKSAIAGDEIRPLFSYDIIEYETPDFESLFGKIEKAKKMVSDGADKKELLELIRDITNELYYHDATMANVSFIEYSKDITSEAVRDEYFGNAENIDKATVKIQELYSVIAESDYASYLEENLYGENFFDSYVGGEKEHDEQYLGLISQENEIEKEYSKAMSDLSVEYKGKNYTVDDINKLSDSREQIGAASAFYKKYNDYLGELYVQLVKSRQKIAKQGGYGSYAEYAFSKIYKREYTADRVNGYIEAVKKSISPMYAEIVKNGGADEILVSLPRSDSEQSYAYAKDVLKNVSEKLYGIYDKMDKKGLCTIGNSDKMYYGSYQTYLTEYEMPYLFVNGSGQIDDILTIIHEFGHFASSFYNYGVTKSNDESEVASQGLELICSLNLEDVIGKDNAELLFDYEKANILSAIVECAQYTDFENKVYADDDISVEKCNKYFEQSCKEFGIDGKMKSGVGEGIYWVFTNHIFEQPYYMIGYSLSADTAIQLALLEKEEKGKGVEKYIEFIKLADDSGTYFEHLKKCGLSEPFDDERVKTIVSLFDK